MRQWLGERLEEFELQLAEEKMHCIEMAQP